ncbi:hypothetical protein [Streptomyces sp. NPDC054794]
MSVYTPRQVSQPQIQQPYGEQQLLGQPPLAQPLYGQQQPWGQAGQQPCAQQGQQLSLLVTAVSLSCAATAVTAVVEQLRMDPQLLMAVQAQGQIPPHAWSNVLTECARRITPAVHIALAQITGQGPDSSYGQQPQSGQLPGLQPQIPLGQGGRFQGLVHQPQFGQLSPQGM